jgi:NAD(P)-dependent dehydrogenase (short-subunit alcohol dehydrogenase family)
VRDEAALADTVQRTLTAFGRLDVAVANAGTRQRGRLEELSAADWRNQLEINVVGAALTARAALPALRARRGRLVLVGSAVAMLAFPDPVAYVASKHALRALGASLAIDLHGSGVSCTTIHPGWVDTDIAGSGGAADGRPRWLMWSSERAARAMLPLIAERRRECVLSGPGRVGAFLGQHLPQLLHLAQVAGAGLRRRS